MLSLAVLSSAFYIFGYYRMLFIFAGLLLQVAYITGRGLKIGRLPLVGPHDTIFFLSAAVMLFSIPIAYKLKEGQRLIKSIVPLVVFFEILSLFYRPYNFPLPPVLKTFWFEAHVVLSFFSYALFGIAGVLGCLFIIRRDGILENLQYKAILIGYLFFSTAMVFGGIWAYLAWGTYWLWTPKELWTVILWLFYTLYLHARLREWWHGKPLALLGIAGFIIVMFTYLGVSLFMKSSHTF